MSGDEQRTTSEAKQHVTARPVTAPSNEAGVARYLGAQHYRERRIHAEDGDRTTDTPDKQET